MEKIAIIGLSCLLPGAENPAQYWQNLIDQKDLTSEANAEQMGVDAQIFYDPSKGKTDKCYCLKGGYIRDFQFDTSGYQIPAELLKNLDKLYQWALYVSKQALQDSGYLENTVAKVQCGVILGNLSFPTRFSHHLFAPIYQKTLQSAIQALLKNDDFRLTSLAHEVSPLNALISGYPSTVIAQCFSLAGPYLSLDAACASSLYAVKLACHYLSSGKADLMLAGAVSCAEPLFINMGFSIFQAYPENGLSRPFDKSSGGLIAGEGASMLVLKRYRDALRDDDHIYATISGIGLSNDGKGKFVLNPNSKGQIIALERAYTDAAGVNPNSIDYIECHATGTPVGDMTELNSMETFFGKHQTTPLFGSVKSNLGHLLTVAGMASLIKVILSMNKGIIPATIHLNNPLSSKKGVFSAKQMVRTTMRWPQEIHTKRAAVSAFGFGGTNAHLILESKPASITPDAGTWKPETPLAIVGMEAFFGGCHNLAEFDRTIYDGIQHFIPLPPQRWQGIDAQTGLLKNYGFGKGEAPLGAYIQDFEIDFLHFKMPARDDDQLIPQQLLMLKVADNAIKDAGLVEGGNVAVIVAMGIELALHQFRGRGDLSWQIKDSLALGNTILSSEQIDELETIVKDSIHIKAQVNQYTSSIGNIMACRIASQWDFSGPAFTISAEENSVFRALEVAQQFLTAGEVDAVVVGAVDLAGGFESVLLRHQLAPINTGINTLSYDEKVTGWLIGEGAGAVVLKRIDTASPDRIYAVIDAISLTSNNANKEVLESLPKIPTAEIVTQACKQAFDIAGIKATDIGYLEVFGSGITQQDEAEIKGLTKAYQLATQKDSLITAIGSVKANIGHTYAASGMASLIKTALCLYHRYIPAVPKWNSPKMPEQWQGSPFYVATESKTWFLEETQTKKVAAINGLGLDGGYAHLILSEHQTSTGIEAEPDKYRQQRLFDLPVAADNQTTLQRKSLIKTIMLGKQHIQAAILTDENLQKFENQSPFSVIQKNSPHLRIIQLQIAVAKRDHSSQKPQDESAQDTSASLLSSHASKLESSHDQFFEPDLKTEAILDSTIYPPKTTQWVVTKPTAIFLTGATGFLGAFLLDELLRRTQADIYCLVRAPDAKLGKIRIQTNLESYQIWNEQLSHRIIPVAGNLAKPQLGLSNEQFEQLAAQIDIIYHSAAWLNWTAPYLTLKPINVLGTQEILRLACQPKVKPVHYISTVAVFESSAYYGKTVFESDPVIHSEGIYLGYSQSKWVAEQLVMKARDRGLPVCIYRPPLISGHSQTGVWNTDDFVCFFIKSCLQMGKFPDLDSLNNLSPVDYVSQAIVFLSQQPQSVNQAFHLNNPHVSHFNQSVEWARYFGYVVQMITYHDWAMEFRKTKGSQFNQFLPLIQPENQDSLTLFQVYDKTKAPQINCQNTLASLAYSAIHCPPFDVQLVKTYLSYFIRSGFLTASKPLKKIESTSPKKTVIWDEADLLEFAQGKIANVFGTEYAIIDSYSRRVRLPTPPYLLVSRVTKCNATRGHFKPCTITTEYDIPYNAWYSVDGQIPGAVAVESGQCDLLLISYLGIDFDNKGVLVYRLLDCTMTFLEEIPQEGNTLRYDISINSFVKHGNNLLFFFSYDLPFG